MTDRVSPPPADSPTAARMPGSVLGLLALVAALVVMIGVLTAVHNSQLFAMAERYNAQLSAMTERHNRQLTEMTAAHNRQLAAQNEACNARLANARH